MSLLVDLLTDSQCLDLLANASSAPSPLSFTFPALDDSRSEIPKKLAPNVADAIDSKATSPRGMDTKFGGAIDI